MIAIAPTRHTAARLRAALLVGGLLGAGACAAANTGPGAPTPERGASMAAPSPDPRVGLRAGLLDAEEAIWNLRRLSSTPPPKEFIGVTDSDLAFKGHYAIQGNYNGIQVWDISDPSRPALVVAYVCPASQSDVSVYQNLLFVSAEGLGGRLDCGTQGVEDTVSAARIRGIRIFDISDIANPEYIGNVQTCRGSHTHSLLVDPDDRENVYIYISGSSTVRPAAELAGCSDAPPGEDANTALFRIEVIQVPLAHPERAAIVSSPRIFSGLEAPPQHGLSQEDSVEIAEARARGAFVYARPGQGPRVLSDSAADALLDSLVEARGGSWPPTAADSAELRRVLPVIRARPWERAAAAGRGPPPGPTQCHDITLYPALGLAGGACGGYGLLIDIDDPVGPERLDAVADSNFAYWHSATFNNDGSKILFTDEWGGGRQPKCRETDPQEWGADAIFTIEDGRMRFGSYYKLPASQTPQENCVAHNGSLIPIPGRDVMVQGWYQGGISVFDWTDPAAPREIAFHDRGPVDSTKLESGGSWSAYWYNGLIVSSEIARGLDIFELVPSPFLSQNEIDAARSVKLDYLNVQGQPRFVWPPTFALAGAYVDQLERSGGLSAERIAALRRQLANAERASGAERGRTLGELASALDAEAASSADAAKVRMLAGALRDLAQADR